MAAFQNSSPFVPHPFLLPVAAITGLMGFAIGHSGKSPWAGGLGVLALLLAIAFFVAQALMKRVKEGETRARLIFENVVDGIMAITGSGVIRSFNPAAEHIFGYSASEALEKNFKDLLAEPCRVKFEDYLLNFQPADKNKATGKRFECFGRRKDGSTFLLEMAMCEVLMGGKPIFTCILEDITERRNVEDALRKAKEAAESATRLKDQFVGLVAHDLKSPFVSILGFLKLVCEDQANPLNPRHRDMIRRSMESGERLLKMVDELLKHCRFRSGKMTLQYSFFDGHWIAASVIEDTARQAREKEIELRNDVPRESRIYADPYLLKEVLSNLISNSIKFCDSGDKIIIFVPPGKETAMAVKDTGQGIKGDVLPKLFHPDFHVTAKGTRGEKGMGLGLSFCREIMEAHGGKITVDSSFGHGSIFYISLPSIRPKVLVVDDDSMAREIIRGFIGDIDAEVMEAESGERAFEILKEFLPHLVVTDLFMPDIDGYKLIHHIRKDPKSRAVPIIAMTSDRDIATRERVFRAGANDFVTKPLMLEEFNPRIKRYVGCGVAA